MENRIENVEKTQEAFRQQMEVMMRTMTERLEAVVVEMRSMRREEESEDSHRGERHHQEGRYGDRESRREERVKRVEVPYFMGEDPHGWIYRVERYFEINRVPEEERVDTAVVCLEGKALNWYQWWESRMMVGITWPMFRQALMSRFQESSSENPYEMLMGLRQRGTVMEYREQFELRSAPLRFADEEFMKGVFMNGLKEEVKAEVRMMGSGGLHELMSLAQKVEERNRSLGRSLGSQNRNMGLGPNRPALTGRWLGAQNLKEPSPNIAESQGAKGNTSGGSENTRGGIPFHREGSGASTGRRGASFRKLTEEEENEKRRKNLCFRCDERYFPGHICRNKQLHVILLGQENEDTEGSEEEAPVVQHILEEQDKEEVNLQLNVSSIAGMTSRNSLKLWGDIKGRKVIVMVDSGASHNFLTPNLVKELK